MSVTGTNRMPLVFDMHSDVPIDVTRRRSAGERRVLSQLHLPRWQAGGVGGATLIVGGDGASMNPLGTAVPVLSALHVLDDVLKDIGESEGLIRVITSAGELADARAAGAFGVLLGIEGATPVGEDLALLRTLWRLGVRLVGLTWNFRNAVAAGVGEGERAGGLSRFGLQVVEEMNHLGMIVDISHLAPDGVRDVLQVSRKPILASHCNARALCDHPRNLTDGQIRAVAQGGGVVGAVFYPGFVGLNPTIDDVASHVLHLLRVAGEEHVGLGPDFIDFALEIFVANLKKAPVAYGDSFTYPTGLEDTTRVAHLLEVLAGRGLSPRTLEKVAWGNFARLLADVVG